MYKLPIILININMNYMIELFISNKRNHNKINVLKDILNLYVKEIKDFS